MGEVAGRRAAGWGLGLLAAYLAVAFSLAQVPAVPWETAVVLLFVGALLLWTVVAGQPVRSLFRRNGSRVGVLALTTVVAASYGAATTGATFLLGFGQRTSSPDAFADVAVAALLVAPLVGGILNALPEELTFRGLYLHAFASAGGVAVGVAASGVLFALAHLPNAVLGWELSGLAFGLRVGHLALFGALLAWAVVRTGTLWVAILWHAGANYSGVLLDTLLASETTDGTALQLWGLVFLVGEAAALWAVVHYGGWGPRIRPDHETPRQAERPRPVSAPRRRWRPVPGARRRAAARGGSPGVPPAGRAGCGS